MVVVMWGEYTQRHRVVGQVCSLPTSLLAVDMPVCWFRQLLVHSPVCLLWVGLHMWYFPMYTTRKICTHMYNLHVKQCRMASSDEIYPGEVSNQ